MRATLMNTSLCPLTIYWPNISYLKTLHFPTKHWGSVGGNEGDKIDNSRVLEVGEYTYKSLLNDAIMHWQLLAEIMHPNWIYENQILAFLRWWKQWSYGRNNNLRIRVRGIFSLLNNCQYKPKSASRLYPWLSTLRTSYRNSLWVNWEEEQKLE